jgi:hypothetical protein
LAAGVKGLRECVQYFGEQQTENVRINRQTRKYKRNCGKSLEYARRHKKIFGRKEI